MTKNHQPLSAKKKQVRLLLAILIALAVLVVVFIIFIIRCDSGACFSRTPIDNQTPPKTSEAITENKVSSTTEPTGNYQAAENLVGATAVLTGTSLVAKDGRVINSGVPVVNSAQPMTATAPKLSAPLDGGSLPAAAIKLTATASGFQPGEFTVKAGQAVTLALTSSGVDSRLVFSDASLSALELPVPNGYTLAKTFNAPDTPGRYSFSQDIPGRREETGTMIVE